MKKRYKILSLILALAMVLTILPLSVLAEETAPTGNVAVMVYSAELTAVLEEGGIESLKAWMNNAVAYDAAEAIPDVTMTLTGEDGTAYAATEDAKSVLNSVNMTSSSGLLQRALDLTGGTFAGLLNKIGFEGLSALAGRFYTTYQFENVPVGTYRLNVDALDRDGYVLAKSTPRSYTDIVVEKGKTTYVGTNKTIGGDITVLGLTVPGVTINFPGLWLAEKQPGFHFTNVNLADDPLAASEFILVNRDDLKKILDFMAGIGRETFTTVLQNLMKQDENGVYNYQAILDLSASVAGMDENGQLQIDAASAFKLVKTFIGLMDNIDLWGEYQAAKENGMVFPAMLQAEADENGVVTFDRTKNVTLTWMLDVILQMAEMGESFVNEDFQRLYEFALKLMNEGSQMTSSIINTVVYPMAQRLGFVGERMPAGPYLMFQTKAPEGYFRSPFVYTVIVTWDKTDWVWANVADIGIIGPYLAEGFYAFVRNTSLAGIADTMINTLAGKEVNLIARALSDGEDNLDVTAAMIAYASQLSYSALGGSQIYASVEAVTKELNKFLYSQGRTTQNLIIFLNNIAKRTKLVYTGSLDADWYFYNLSKSLFSNTNMLINKTAREIENAIVLPEGQEKTGIITTVASQVTDARARRGEFMTNLFKQVVDRASARSASLIKSLLENLRNKN